MKSILIVGLLFALAAPSQAGWAEDNAAEANRKKEARLNGIATFGLSGNVVAGVSDQTGPAPGLGASIMMMGDGAAWCGAFGDDCGSKRIMARVAGEGQFATLQNEDRVRTIGSVQGRFGFGIKEKNGVYYLLSSNMDWDGFDKRDGKVLDNQEAFVSVTGGELGKQFRAGDSTVFAGVYSGIGTIEGVNGRPTLKEEENGATLHRMPSQAKLALGASLQARLRAPRKVGTTLVQGTATWLGGRDYRGDISAQVNVSPRLQVGAGVRALYIEEEDRRDVNVVQPMARFTLSGF